MSEEIVLKFNSSWHKIIPYKQLIGITFHSSDEKTNTIHVEAVEIVDGDNKIIKKEYIIDKNFSIVWSKK